MNYKKIIKNQDTRFLILKILGWVPDKLMLAAQYRLKLGRYLNIKNPQRFTEKIQHYKMFYRNPEMLECTDKYLVRKYVESRIGETYLNKLLGVYKNADDINFNELPPRFVIKTTDGGGGDNVLICRNKDVFDISKAISLLRKWKNRNLDKVTREWAYNGARESLIIIEEYLEDLSNVDTSIDDYKFFCFNGKVHYVVVDVDRYSGHKRNFYDIDWNKIDIASDCPNFNYEKKRPINYEEMLQIAGKLSNGFPFVRVDLYNIQGRIIFGELTFYPWSGCVQFSPDEFDFELGAKFNINY